jgi:hypothetical protein
MWEQHTAQYYFYMVAIDKVDYLNVVTSKHDSSLMLVDEQCSHEVTPAYSDIPIQM